MTLKEQIANDIKNTPIILYMKGTKERPMCGFSATVVEILTKLGLKFHSINVLDNPEIREGIKIFSDWPTIPQLYIKGEFVGGCDIVKEMFEKGELQTKLKEKKISYKIN